MVFPAWRCTQEQFSAFASDIEEDMVEVKRLEDNVSGVADISYATLAVRVKTVFLRLSAIHFVRYFLRANRERTIHYLQRLHRNTPYIP